MRSPRSSTHRAYRAFWTLIVIAALAMGALTKAWKSDPGPLTGLAVAASGTVLVLSLTLACRIMIALDHAHRRMNRSSR